MILGAGALKVSGRPNAISREEVSMATLEVGTTPRGAINRHRHSEWNSVEILTWENTVLWNHTAGREEREIESAMICKKAKIDPVDQQAKLQCHITLTTTTTTSLCTCTFYLSVNVFSPKVLIEDTIFTSPNGDGTAILRGHPSHTKV